MFLGMGLHITGIVWVALNDCTSEHMYGMAVFNVIWFFLYFIVMLTAVLVIYFMSLSSHNKKHRAVASNQQRNNENDNLAEYEERMISDREPRGGDNDENTSGDHNNKNKPSIDPKTDDDGEDAKDNKNEGELEEEEIY